MKSGKYICPSRRAAFILLLCGILMMGLMAGNADCHALAKANNKAAAKTVKKIKKITVTGVRYAKPNRSIQFTAKIKPKKNKGVKWKSSNTAVAKVSAKGRVRTIAPGTAAITATAKDGSGKKGSAKITVYKMGSRDVPWIAHRGVNTKATENSFRSTWISAESMKWSRSSN